MWKPQSSWETSLVPVLLQPDDTELNFSNNNFNLLDVKLLQEAEKCIVKMVQSKYFNEELNLLKMKNKENVKISSKIQQLKFLSG